MENKIEKTCGVFLVSYDGLLLIGHPTNGTYWSIPKGLMNHGETESMTAIREFQEETSILLSDTYFRSLRTKRYPNGKKELRPFLFNAFITHDQFTPVCNSMVELPGKEPFPEFDEFRWVGRNEAKTLLHPVQADYIDDISGLVDDNEEDDSNNNLEIERRWLLKAPPALDMNISYIKQYYTADGNRYRMVGYKEQDTGFWRYDYYHTFKKRVSPGINEEMETSISEEYFKHCAASAVSMMKKIRHTFEYSGHTFEIDGMCFKGSTMPTVWMMEVELDNLHEEIQYPKEILDVMIREITGDDAFSNYKLSEKITETPLFDKFDNGSYLKDILWKTVTNNQ